MPYESLQMYLEAVMLICFGFSWPVSIAKSLRTRFVRGKSAFFMWVIFCGYIAGIGWKIAIAVENNEAPQLILGLYIINLLLVGVDLGLYYKLYHNLQPVERQLAHELAEPSSSEKQEESDV